MKCYSVCCITACRVISVISCPHPAICVVLLSVLYYSVLLSVLYYSVSRDPTDQRSPPSHLCSVTQCVVLQRCITACYSVCCITACREIPLISGPHPAICVVLLSVLYYSVLLSVLYYSVSRDPTNQRSPPSHLCSVTQCVVLQRVTQCVILQRVERSH